MKLYFKPTLLGIFATVFLASLFAGLGRWQLNRADEKTQILDAYQTRAVELASVMPERIENPEQWRYRKVHISASPLTSRQFLLDNQTRNGRVGFNVLTPFRPVDGRLLLVDRGWVPLGASRSDLPDVSMPSESLRLEGLIYVPYEKAFTLGGMDDGELGWPRIIQFLDFETLGQRLGEPLRPFTLRLDPAAEHGYLRNWPIIAVSPDKHLAYAFQWFALAVGVGAVFIALTLRQRK